MTPALTCVNSHHISHAMSFLLNWGFVTRENAWCVLMIVLCLHRWNGPHWYGLAWTMTRSWLRCCSDVVLMWTLSRAWVVAMLNHMSSHLPWLFILLNNVISVSQDNATALTMAYQDYSQDLIDMLLDHGADMNFRHQVQSATNCQCLLQCTSCFWRQVYRTWCDVYDASM